MSGFLCSWFYAIWVLRIINLLFLLKKLIYLYKWIDFFILMLIWLLFVVLVDPLNISQTVVDLNPALIDFWVPRDLIDRVKQNDRKVD